MIRVRQAAGRVIRSETDRGLVLLLDSRFASASYIGLFPSEWMKAEPACTPEEIAQRLREFWG